MRSAVSHARSENTENDMNTANQCDGTIYEVKKRRFLTLTQARAYAYRVLKKDGQSVSVKRITPFEKYTFEYISRTGDKRICTSHYSRYLILRNGSAVGGR